MSALLSSCDDKNSMWIQNSKPETNHVPYKNCILEIPNYCCKLIFANDTFSGLFYCKRKLIRKKDGTSTLWSGHMIAPRETCIQSVLVSLDEFSVLKLFSTRRTKFVCVCVESTRINWHTFFWKWGFCIVTTQEFGRNLIF